MNMIVARPPTWQEIFGNNMPVEVEIGPGKGSFLLAMARTRSDRNFFAVEISKHRAFRLAKLIERDGPANVIAIHADFSCLLHTMIWPASVSVYHIYFPDPWWKRRHHKRRLLQNNFTAALVYTLCPGGKILLASDVEEYFHEIVRDFTKEPELSQFPWTRDQVTQRGKPIRTDFEKKYATLDRPLYYTGFQKRSDQSFPS